MISALSATRPQFAAPGFKALGSAPVADRFEASPSDDTPAPVNFKQMLSLTRSGSNENQVQRPVGPTASVRLPGLDKVWKKGFTGHGQTVAVIDSGIFPHADFKGNVVAWLDLAGGKNKMHDNRGHGTHVAGIIAGDGRKSGGQVQGVAPDANLVGIRIASIEDAIEAIDWVIAHKDEHGISVINLSLGETATRSAKDDPWCQAVQRAIDAGITVVVAAGNEGHLGKSTISTPGIAPQAITVGGVDDQGTVDPKDDKLYTGSSQGPTPFDRLEKPDVYAPAVCIYSTLSPGSQADVPSSPRLGQDYVAMMGTSMATPAVAGLVALLKQARPDLGPLAIKEILTRSVFRGEQNLPIVQADAALKLAQSWKAAA